MVMTWCIGVAVLVLSFNMLVRCGSMEVELTLILEVVKGEDVALKFGNEGTFPESCVVYLPPGRGSGSLRLLPLPADHAPRVDYWGDGRSCGMRVLRVDESDAGSWHVLLCGQRFSFLLEVVQRTPNETLSISVDLGSTLPLVSWDGSAALSASNYSICEVFRPGGCPLVRGFRLHHHASCEVVVHAADRRDSGKWRVMRSVVGQLEAVLAVVNVHTEGSDLLTGWRRDEVDGQAAVTVFCNVERREKWTKDSLLCRLEPPRNKAGLQLTNVTTTGHLVSPNHECPDELFCCGVTILEPSAEDEGLWRCTVIVQAQPPLVLRDSVLVSKVTGYLRISPERSAQLVKPLQLVLGEINKTVAVEGSNHLSSCIFVTPGGTPFVGIREELRVGRCAVIVPQVLASHAGVWRCYFGERNNVDDMQLEVSVRVTGSVLVAANTSVNTLVGHPLEILCVAQRVEQGWAGSKPATLPLAYCRFIRPDGRQVGSGDYRYHYHGVGLAAGECGLRTEAAGIQDHGRWACVGRLHAGVVVLQDEINVTVQTGEAAIFPAIVHVARGEAVLLRLRESVPMDAPCTVLLPTGEAVNLRAESQGAVSPWGSAGQCGVRVDTAHVNITTDTEMWSLKSLTPEGKPTAGTAQIHIEDVAARLPHPDWRQVVVLGQPLKLMCPAPRYSKYCVFVRPGSRSVHAPPGGCTLHIVAVTSAEIGTWTCRFSGGLSLLEGTSTIEVALANETLSAHWSMNSTALDVSCRWPGAIRACRMQPPGDSAFSLSDGLARDRYSYLGNGLQAGHCGVRVSAPHSDDTGAWRCYVHVQGEANAHVQLLFVTSVPELTVQPDAAVATTLLGDQLSVGCHAEARLKYCWLRHPNGAYIHPQELALGTGECGIKLANATLDDSGTWTCHVGIEGRSGLDMAVNVTVLVTTSHLFAERAEVAVALGDVVTLLCQTLPPLSALAYCRFQRPDGWGMHLVENSSHGRYAWGTGVLEQGFCALKIRGVSYSDLGVWHCAGRMKGLDEESMGGMSLLLIGKELPASTVAGVGLGGTLLLAALLGAVVWIVRLKSCQKLSTSNGQSDNTYGNDVMSRTRLQVLSIGDVHVDGSFQSDTISNDSVVQFSQGSFLGDQD